MAEFEPNFPVGQTVYFIGNTFYGMPGVETTSIHEMYVTRAIVEDHPDSGAPVEVTVFRPHNFAGEPPVFSGNVKVSPYRVFTETQVDKAMEELSIFDAYDEADSPTDVTGNSAVSSKLAKVLSVHVAERTMYNPGLQTAPRPQGVNPVFWEKVLEVRTRMAGQHQEAVDGAFDSFWGQVLASA